MSNQLKSREGFLGYDLKILLLIIICFHYICFTTFLVKSSPLGDPIHCSSGTTNCTITNSYGAFPDRTTCRAAQVFYPANEQDLISVVSDATSQKRKMKIATSTSHSIPKLACPDGEDGILISTKYLNKTVEIDRAAMTVTVQPGLTVRELINVTAVAGLAVPPVPYWWGLTVGGVLGTGAHGSSLWGLGSCLHDYVIQLRIVTPAGADEGYVKVRTLKIGDPDLDAAKVSLGVLGVISQVTLQLEPLYKRSISLVEKKDSDMADQVWDFGKEHEFGDITWYPSQKRAVYRIDGRVPSDTPGDGVFDFLGFRPVPSHYLVYGRIQEESLEAAASVGGGGGGGECAAYGSTENESQDIYGSPRVDAGRCATARSSPHMAMAFGLTNDGISFTGYPVVGYNNRLQASGSCLDSPDDDFQTVCSWEPRIKGFFFFQSGISISLSKAKNFIEDVQKLVDMEPDAFCGLEFYNGILIRYVPASTAYLGKDEDSLDLDIAYYRSTDPMTPRLHQEVFEEVEQMALFKYGGVPHWGKNQNRAFVGAINKYKRAHEFLKVKQDYDPLGLFSNEWTDQILGLKDGITIMKEGCGLEGLCICSEDIHCAPNKGYFCRPGKVYKDARVCAPLPYQDDVHNSQYVGLKCGDVCEDHANIEM